MATYDLRYTIPSASQIAAGDILNAPYSANTTNVPPYAVTLPKGVFKLEVWGASAYASPGGSGGYAVGTLSLLENTATYVIPGRIGIGLNESGASHNNGGKELGGDATDIRLLSNTLNNRIIVAGGGGGAGATGASGDVLAGGYGGGAVGGDGTSRSGTSNAGKGGTATAGGVGGTRSGSWGEGGNPNGGGGWYGGGSSYLIDYSALNFSGAGGGSGFVLTLSSVANVPSSYASALKDAKYYLSNTQLIAGNASMPKPAGGTENGHGDSGYARITVISLTPLLPAPTDLTTSGLSANSVTLTWTASSVSGVSYKVYRGNTLLTTTASTTYADTGISPGGTYTYKVTATKSGYTDSPEITVSITNKPRLSAPSGISATYTTSTTTISWGAVSGANAYKVWRGSTYIGQQTGTYYTDSSAGKSTSYVYKISAVDTTNAKYESVQASFSSSNPSQLPTPSNLSASYTSTSTTITWSAVTNATAYKVWRGSTLVASGNNTLRYTDTSAGASSAYTYKVSATASGYYESAQASITTSNNPKLATPTGLSASYNVSSTTIAWSAVTNATAYKVWRGSTLVASSNTTRSYTDSSAGAGASNTYKVSATANGYYDSDQASLSTTNQPRLSAPTGLTASYTQTSTTISWSAVTNAASYRIYRDNTSLGTTTSRTYTDSSTYGQSGQNHTYKVSALATSGYYESAQATIATSNPSTLATPTGLAATYTQTQTTITWVKVPSATSYLVYRGSTLVSTTGTNSYTDTSAGSNTSFTYKVMARNSTSFYDSADASITSNNPPTLSAPTNITGSQTVSSVDMSWTAVTNATQYIIRRVVNGVSGNPVTVSTNSYTDNTTRPGTTYTYYISASAANYYQSTGTPYSIEIYQRLEIPSIFEVSQTQTSITLSIGRNGTIGTLHLYRDGTLIASETPSGTAAWVYTDSGLESKKTYVYSVYTEGDAYHYDSIESSLTVYIGRNYTNIERQRMYLQALTAPMIKLCRLRFLYPNGATAFSLDNNIKNRRSKAFIQDGTVNANMQNGQRLTASVTIANANQEFNFNINQIWFGQEVALDEGLVLPNGEEYWRQTGVFVIDNPQETINPDKKTVTYNLVDKWADLDGTLDGNLEGTYEVAVNTNIFTPIAALLSENRGNDRPVDRLAPVFTNYYNSRTQTLPDGTSASMVRSPYTLTIDGDGGTIGSVALGLCGMVNAWVGYDNTGRLRIDPSQDDIIDAQKPVLYRFSQNEITLLGLAYTIKKEDLFNDYIVVGEQMDDYSQPGGRAQNLDPRSDTNVNVIGRKTKRESASGFATVQQCKDLAEWRLKRSGVLQKAVNISCSQMFHIELNSLVEIVRTDKQGSPTERHLIQGYSRPLATNGAMTITAVSVNDFPSATVTQWPQA